MGADDAEFERRATAIGRDPDELRRNGIAGTVPQAIAAVAKARDAGAQRIYLQILDLSDLDHLELIAREVVPAFA